MVINETSEQVIATEVKAECKSGIVLFDIFERNILFNHPIKEMDDTKIDDDD
jgi:hypothetical protein